MSKICSNCQKENPDINNFCIYCGTRLNEETNNATIKDLGNKLKETAGTVSDVAKSGLSKLIYGIISFFKKLFKFIIITLFIISIIFSLTLISFIVYTNIQISLQDRISDKTLKLLQDTTKHLPQTDKFIKIVLKNQIYNDSDILSKYQQEALIENGIIRIEIESNYIYYYYKENEGYIYSTNNIDFRTRSIKTVKRVSKNYYKFSEGNFLSNLKFISVVKQLIDNVKLIINNNSRSIILRW